MKTFLLDIIPNIKRYSKKLDDISVITNKHWYLIDEERTEKTVFIFRQQNNQLLISNNGRIEKGSWEYVGNNSLVIDKSDGSYLFKHGFVDDTVLALKVDGKEEYAILVNENKIEQLNLKSVNNIVEFLQTEYIGERKNKVLESNSPITKDVVIVKTERVSDDFKNFPFPSFEEWKTGFILKDLANKYYTKKQLKIIYNEEKGKIVPKPQNTNTETNQDTFPTFTQWIGDFLNQDLAHKFYSQGEKQSIYNKEKEKFYRKIF